MAALKQEGRWWARIDDRVFHAQHPVASPRGDNYYYALGSHEALSAEMKAHRVGGQGRVHIFQLPRGPSMLQVQAMGDRRATVSKLVQLRQGTVLNNSFPVFVPDAHYQHPLSAGAQDIELAGARAITSDGVMTYLTELVHVAATRSYADSEGTEAAVQFLRHNFDKMGLTTCIQHFVRDGAPFSNVIGYRQGTTAPERSVTVGAHYDSRPFTGKAPGAEDNGSGVAVLLAVAEAFMKAQIAPERSIYFVAFSGEEPGLYGSDEFAMQVQQNGDGIPAECRPGVSLLAMQPQAKLRGRKRDDDHVALILDEVGWKSPSFHKTTINLEADDRLSTELMQHLANANTMHNGDALGVVHNSQPFGSDHVSFLKRGIPAVLSINADDEAYPNYHQSTDTLDNVDGPYTAMVAKMNFGALLRVGGVQT